MIEPIVSADAARRLVDDPSHTVVLADVRWYLDGRSGRAAFEAGHLPGAIFVDIDEDLAAHGLPPTAGRHPFPTADEFAASLGRLGITDDCTVIATDDTGGMTAGRLVWMLRIIGQDAALLDGGMTSWTDDLEFGPGRLPAPVQRTVVPWPSERLPGADDVAGMALAGGDTLVIDARSAERFRGDEGVSVDLRRGHIPGACNAPWAANLDPTSLRFRPRSELSEHYAALGVSTDSTVVGSCGSGVSACADLLALEAIGVRDTRLFVASWSGWSADDTRDIALGGA